MGARWELTATGAVRCRVGREWHIQDSSVSIQEAFVEFNWARQTTWLKTLKNYSHEKKKRRKKKHQPSQYQVQNWIFCSVACFLLKWRQGKQGRGRGALFESLNLYALLQYQAPRTRSDADTFVEGWQISCPSRCLIAWPLFTKWWRWWERGRRRERGGLTALNSASVNEGPHAGNTHVTLSISNSQWAWWKSNQGPCFSP